MLSDNLCKGCFSEKGNQEECPYCNYNDNSDRDSSIFLTSGTLLTDKYIIGNVLGQGGFGITYLAYDLSLRLKLAIKEFFPQGMVTRLSNRYEVTAYSGNLREQYEFGMERFLNEAQTLARFAEHPNIVTVRDFFKANGTAYMVMQYVKGFTLEEYLKREGGRIPFQKALNIMMPIMDALREVHGEGYMHRDISPDNVFIDTKGRVILIDFGAARQDMREKSKSLSVILKPGYAPEEQYRSKGRQGPWTDVYAVAATIYRAITGEIPPESMDRMVDDCVELPSVKGINIDDKQEKVLMKAMSVMGANRYQDIEGFQQAFLA